MTLNKQQNKQRKEQTQNISQKQKTLYIDKIEGEQPGWIMVKYENVSRLKVSKNHKLLTVLLRQYSTGEMAQKF